MKISKHHARLDNVGMTASILCAVHCAVVPVLITSLPLLGLGFLANPWVEWSMIVFALCIGSYAIGFSYLHVHHKPLPLIVMAAGFLVIIAGHFLVTGWREAIVVPMGGLLIATAHFINYKYTGMCRLDSNGFHIKHSHLHKN